MPPPPPVQPDLGFKRRLLGLGAHDLNACYQCGTCSTVCPISMPDNPFPRKEMVRVQWGLKDLALSNSSIWLCHQCGACTAYCPRDAKPADVMAALREYSIEHYAVPRFLGRALNDPRCLPLLFLLPALIFALILAHLGHLTSLPPGQIVYAKFFPVPYIDGTFLTALALSFLGAFLGARRYWRAMSSQAKENGTAAAPAPSTWIQTLRAIVQHRKFKECGDTPPAARKTYKEHLLASHRLASFGFLGLIVTTASVGIGLYVFNAPTPWPLWHPVKILGNVSGLAVLCGIAILGYRRAVDQAKAGRSAYADWLFLDVLVLTALTGFATEALRLGGVRELAYPTYFIHLLLIFFLLVYFPYSKFAHVVYRTIAMLHTPGFTAEANSAPPEASAR